jgi:hypothetical protein
MRSIFYVVIVLFVLVGLTCGCTEKAELNKSISDVQEPLQQGQQQQPAAGTSKVDVNINSQRTAYQIGSGYLVATPKAGYKYVIYDVTVKNLNAKDEHLGNPFFFKLKTSDGSVYQYTASSYLGDNSLSGVSNTQPGEKVTGQIAFEIPQKAAPSVLTYDDYSNTVNIRL